MLNSYCRSKPISYAVVEDYCTGGIVILVFNGSDKLGANAVLPHGSAQGRMPYRIKGLPEIYEDMIQALLMLKVFLAKHSKVEDLFTVAPSCSKTHLFFSDDLFCLRFESVELSRIFNMTLLGWLMRLIVL